MLMHTGEKKGERKKKEKRRRDLKPGTSIGRFQAGNIVTAKGLRNKRLHAGQVDTPCNCIAVDETSFRLLTTERILAQPRHSHQTERVQTHLRAFGTCTQHTVR